MITIVDYGMGNLGSIKNMLRKVGVQSQITSNHEEIKKATKLILPGVGAFDRGMENLNRQGVMKLLNEKVVNQKTPILGICLGMQLFAKQSEEGQLPGLGWINSTITRFNYNKRNLPPVKIPHMGWNHVVVQRKHPLFSNFQGPIRFYFVHAYHLECTNKNNISSTAIHGYEFVASIQDEHIMGVQFHPEKSHKFGMQLLKNFAEL